MSLATRLSAFFLLALALALVGFSSSLYLFARGYMLRHLDEHIMADLDALTVAVEAGPERVAAWDERRPAIGLDPEVEQVFWVIYDGQGRPVDRSKNSGVEDFSGRRGLIAGAWHAHDSFTGKDGDRWRLALRRLEAERPTPLAREWGEGQASPPVPAPKLEPGPKAPPAWGRPALILMAGASLAPLEATLWNLAAALAALSVALWGLAAAAGRILCRRALAPMARMAEAASAMTMTDRGQHLPSPETGDELQDLARSFNGLLDRLNEALERQEQFTGEASHQLRNPLAALIGEIEVARRRDRTVEEYREILDEVHGDAVRLRQIIEAMLFLSRADAEAVRPALERLDLAAWVAAHLGRWAGHERANDLRGPEAPDDPLWVRAHPPMLGQLLDNLLENACKYSKPGTPIRVLAWREDGVVTLAVEDRGLGLSAEDLPHVFEPFYRSEQARLLGHPGFGLGLAVVRRIAAAFGGSVGLESDLGRGSRFLIRLPEDEASIAPPETDGDRVRSFASDDERR